MLAPDALGDRYHVDFYGDDIAWLWVDADDGRLYGDEPGVRRLRRRQGHQRDHQPDRARARSPRAPATIFTNVAYNADTQEVWWEGRTPEPPADVAGWLDWKGDADRRPRPDGDDEPVGAPEQPLHHHAGQRAQHRRRTSTTPPGVPIDAIIFGGRTRDREPLIRAITDLAEGVYDGLTLGAEATFAAEGVEGAAALRPDVDAPVHGLRRGRLRRALAEDRRRRPRTSRSSRTSTGSSATPRTATSCWPGYRDNLRAAAVAAAAQERRGQGPRRRRSASSRPRRSSTSTAWTSRPRTSSTILSHRRRPLAAGDGLPRGAPRAVRPTARGDLGGAPPRRRRARGDEG